MPIAYDYLLPSPKWIKQQEATLTKPINIRYHYMIFEMK